ncbi:MAG: hypothetical protein QXJ09_03610 [Candidatus Caldarchaeum sp.]
MPDNPVSSLLQNPADILQVFMILDKDYRSEHFQKNQAALKDFMLMPLRVQLYQDRALGDYLSLGEHNCVKLFCLGSQLLAVSL